MRIGDYYRGVRIELATKLPPDEVERRINEGAQSILTPFASGVIGWARFGAIRLRFRRSRWFRNDARPILAGHIRPDRGGSLLHLVWRGPVPMLIFFPFFYLILLAFGGIWIAVGVAEAEPMVRAVFATTFLIMLATPALVLLLGVRGAEADLEALLAFLKERLVAHEVAPRPI